MSNENNQNGIVEYGSDEYYAETGQSGTTINNKQTKSKYCYNAECYFWDSYHNRLIFGNYKYTQNNLFYRDENGKEHLWHRKRKGKIALVTIDSGHAMIYVDAEAYYVIYDYTRRFRVHSFVPHNGEKILIATMLGSSKFDDTDHYYVGTSEDSSLFQARLKLDGGKDWWSTFASNQVNNTGHFYAKNWRKDDDPGTDNIRRTIYCENYNGLNHSINTVAKNLYEDLDVSNLEKGKPTLIDSSHKYPICSYYYNMNSSGGYKPELNTYLFAYHWSSYSSYGVNYRMYKLYNANTKNDMYLPFINNVDALMAKWSYREDSLIDIKNAPLGFLKACCITPYVRVIGSCPNGNVLISITYINTDHANSTITEEYPEYRYFLRFYRTPQYYVINYGSGSLVKSNIKEPLNFDIDTEYLTTMESYYLPKGLYTDDEYLWFMRPYNDVKSGDINFYGTKDGYNIDKRYTYYNRTSVPYKAKIIHDGYEYNGNISLVDFSYVDYYRARAIPIFENCKYLKTMALVAAQSDLYMLVDDLKPNSEGILESKLAFSSATYATPFMSGANPDKRQPGQSVDDYIFEIE